MKKCPKCGYECPDGAKFCPEDGYRFPQVAAAAVAPAPEPYSGSDPDTDEWGAPAQANAGPSKFSETAWFMAAVKPENLASQAGEADLEGKYERNDSLSDEERKKYSLNREKPGKGNQ